MKSVDIERIYSGLKKHLDKNSYELPLADSIELETKDPFKVLAGTVLSARTKDTTTSKAAARLFRRAGTPEQLEKLSVKEIEKLIYPVGFYKTKAKHLKLLPKFLRENFNGEIPQDIDSLVKLPGVGRKTANLVVAVAFRKPAICVDTHVHRIMNRLGYVKTKDPLGTEMELRKKLPVKYWISINTMLVTFGQNLCTPVSPKCSICPIIKYCNRVDVSKSR